MKLGGGGSEMDRETSEQLRKRRDLEMWGSHGREDKLLNKEMSAVGGRTKKDRKKEREWCETVRGWGQTIPIKPTASTHSAAPPPSVCHHGNQTECLIHGVNIFSEGG